MPASIQDILTVAESNRYAIRHEIAFQFLDTALLSSNLSPADLNFIRLRKLDYQIEYFWLYNRLIDELPILQIQLETARDDARFRADDVQLAYATFLTAHLHYFHLFEADSPDLDAVENLWIQAYDLYSLLQDERGMSESLFYRGLVYQRFKSDEDEAFNYFQRAHALLQDKNHPLELSEILRHTGYVYQHRGDLETARVYYEQAVALLEHLGFRVFLPLALFALGNVMMEQGRLDEAALHFERTLSVAQEAPLNILHVAGFVGLGDLYIKKGDPARAHEYYSQAHDTAQTIHSTRFIRLAAEKLALLSSQ